jgi:hypothetical protein
MLSVADKASKVSDEIAEQTIAREIYTEIVGGLTPSWAHNEEIKFLGDANKFSGLTAHIPSETNFEFGEVTVFLKIGAESEVGLNVMTPNFQSYELTKFSAGDVSFEYMGADQIFYSSWPPEKPRSTQSKGQILLPRDDFFDLPQLIRLKHTDLLDNEKTQILLVAAVYGSVEKPRRLNLNTNHDF